MDIYSEKASIEDLNEINQIMRLSKGYWGYSSLFLDQFMSNHSITENRIKNINIYSVYIKDRIKGFYGFKKNEDHQDELNFLFLHPSYIKKGIGRQLWQLCLKTAKELKIKEFIIYADPNAEGFYLKMKCTKLGTKPSTTSPYRFTSVLHYSLK